MRERARLKAAETTPLILGPGAASRGCFLLRLIDHPLAHGLILTLETSSRSDARLRSFVSPAPSDYGNQRQAEAPAPVGQ